MVATRSPRFTGAVRNETSPPLPRLKYQAPLPPTRTSTIRATSQPLVRCFIVAAYLSVCLPDVAVAARVMPPPVEGLEVRAQLAEQLFQLPLFGTVQLAHDRTDLPG